MIDLESELRAAQALASDPRCAPAFDFPADLAGAGYVEIAGTVYQPAGHGDPAVIVAVESGGELIDLAAIRLRDRATATRLGVATLLGEDAVEAALLHDRALLVYSSALHWLQAGCLGVVVLDWRSVPWALAGVSEIKCATPHLEEQVRLAFALPANFPTITSLEARHAA
ncbi:hypothetical protein [Reyranella sp.]|jgi:hypothetical protein|uniref:hypothetical protein n=1 Tax=Reyranella sp. TaxID=1929291 RepID=UPI000BCBD237|nr:hypothetical protein [Reyranella sp.]OYY46064.1 MAG: hypothetical protein B7Y57_04210 [Rhodospirillales bacterium 35-66-84]OYZ96444.1 MAG: hypothetical protein B7Y08_04570 [Rhodospirillales bacterium 24-66-33]OZB28393.1 MAG: hypothetical protein B7X63_00575 [Rhodospirillales bacterium 39-66-50]HQS14398.1 hypothetical protein [Reyranella sp.]HQT11395.1 hypothetical protein [Reyranella sp.]